MASLKPRAKMLHDERIIKKRLGNPDLWKQLNAISNGTWVNYLGRGHTRRNPAAEEREWEERVTVAEHGGCRACAFGGYRWAHNHDCAYIKATDACSDCQAENPHVHLG